MKSGQMTKETNGQIDTRKMTKRSTNEHMNKQAKEQKNSHEQLMSE